MAKIINFNFKNQDFIKEAKEKVEKKTPKNLDKKHKGLSIALLIILAVLVIFILAINFLTDWLWFKEVGYVKVFFTRLFTRLKFGVPLAAVLSVLMFFYLTALKKGYFKKIVSKEDTNIKKLGRYTLFISIAFGIVIAVYFVSNLWFQLLQFSHSTDFGIRDPLFNMDVSFYVFKLEFLNQLNELLLGVLVLFFLATILYYMILLVMHSPDVFEEDEAIPLENGKPVQKNKLSMSKTNFSELAKIGGTQLTLLGVIFFLMVGVNFFLKQFDLLHVHTGVVYGAGYTDVKVTLWAYRLLAVLAVVGAVATAIFMRQKKYKRIAIIPVAMVIVLILSGGIAQLVQNIIVAPDEINKESEYLANNIKFTQYAYDIDDVDVRDFIADQSLNAEMLGQNLETLTNIRINDYPPVNTFYNQTQSIRQYYAFNDVDVDRYILNGEYTQTYLSTREIDESKVNDTWLNRHIKYTHGYGVAVSRVDTITANGQPSVIVRNIPPQTEYEELKVTRPEVYFGELSSDYIIVGTDETEFDYPDGQENKYTAYEGTAGINLNPINRLMFAIREASMKLLVSTNINSDSRIIINRNIVDRVSLIMPYLTYEGDPYAVLVDGRIYWIIDAYSTSSYYPYSEPYSGQIGTPNYYRNSIKVIVDAYNGSVDYYIVDEDDPIALTYQKIYPDLFKNFSDMPEGIKEHIRYPHALFQIQADVYGRYHMNDVNVFYQEEDIWSVAHEMYGTEEKKMTSNFFVLKLPGESSAEFVSSLPYTPKGKQNMTAQLISRSDGEHYGELVLYRYPKSKTIYGPMQIEAQIDQNTVISQDFSLWSQAGSRYSRGNLFVIPIENSLLYVEPIYLEASNSAIPEVKRVIVAYGDKIAYEDTLRGALKSLFGDIQGLTSDEPVNPVTSDDGDVIGLNQDQLIERAQAAYDNAQDALKQGDWAAYGRYMDELETVLKALSGDQNDSMDFEPGDEITENEITDTDMNDAEGIESTGNTEDPEEENAETEG